MEVRWTLRMAAAKREVWTGAQLRRLLVERAGVELSAASVSALMTKTPRQLKLATLAALCTALDCQPGELIEVDTTPAVQVPSAKREGTRKHRSGGGGSGPHRRSDERRLPRLRHRWSAARVGTLSAVLWARQARL